MKCKVCGCKSAQYHKMQDGKICINCYDKLPIFIKADIDKIPSYDLKKLVAIFRDKNYLYELLSIEKKAWLVYGEIAFFNEYVKLADSYIYIKDIQRIELTFIPRCGYGSECYGDICLIFELKYKKYRFRTLFTKSKLTTRISNGKFYVKYPSEVEKIMLYFEKAIVDGSLFEVKEIYFQDLKKKKEQQRRQKNTKAPDVLKDALELFQLSFPYSTSVLKKRYKELIIKCHPDQMVRDRTLKPEDVNRYYDLLKTYATL